MQTRNEIRRLLGVLAIALFIGVGCSPLGTVSGYEASVSRKFLGLRDKPTLLREFLEAMPKGGDIHNHINGAVYAESYIEWAAADGKCISRTSFVVTTPPCAGDAAPAASFAADDALRTRVIDAWSMRNFVAAPGASAHDQFFATFSRFGGATSGRDGDVLAEVVRRSADQNVQYLELMLTPAGSESAAVASAIPWTDDLTANMNAALNAPELTAAILAGSVRTSATEARKSAILECPGAEGNSACATQVRYVSQVYRNAEPRSVFGQLMTAFQIAATDTRFVGVNLVGAEDERTAMSDYSLHMRMLEVLHTRFPDVKIALHAGELTLGLVPPEGLASHVRQAVTTGNASRIGHGVDIGYEPGAADLMTYMADNGIAVEILLSSNAQTLNVSGDRHPFTAYRAAGVTTIIATDDQGVSRSDITNEYQRAVESFGLAYKDLKSIVRSSIEKSFIEGRSLWKDPQLRGRVDECANDDALGSPSGDCRAFLDQSPKATAEWRLETAFVTFERWAAQRFSTAVTTATP